MGYHAGEKTIIITAVAQDHKTGEVLVVAFMDKEALRRPGRQKEIITGAGQGANSGKRGKAQDISRSFMIF